LVKQLKNNWKDNKCCFK